MPSVAAKLETTVRCGRIASRIADNDRWRSEHVTKRIGEAAHRALCGGAVELQFKEWTDGGQWTLILIGEVA
jgi:hypothetical protein